MTARILGFLYGDGCCYKNESNGAYVVEFEHSRKNIETVEKYYQLMRKFGSVLKVVKGDKIRVTMYSKSLFQLLKKVKNNPEKYFKSLEEPEKLYFILGFLDADGSITKNEIVIYDKNKILLEAIHDFLKMKRIKSNVRRNKNIWRLRIRSKNSLRSFLILMRSLESNPVGEGEKADSQDPE